MDRVDQGGQEPVPHPGIGGPPQGPGEPDGAGGRAGLSSLTLEGEEVEQRGLLVGAPRPAGKGDQSTAPHRRRGLLVGGIEHHALGPPPDGVVPGQLGEVEALLVARRCRSDHRGHLSGEGRSPDLEGGQAIGLEGAAQDRPQVPIGDERVGRKGVLPGGQGLSCRGGIHAPCSRRAPSGALEVKTTGRTSKAWTRRREDARAGRPDPRPNPEHAGTTDGTRSKMAGVRPPHPRPSPRSFCGLIFLLRRAPDS